jgi:UDP-N-acetylglucosamine 2-epimerase (non-hydrolysing)
MRVAVVQGTRPEIIKNYSIVRALREARIPFDVLHTNQHTAREMRDDVYAQMRYAYDFSLPRPYTLGRAIDWLQFMFAKCRVTHVIVNGDTAAALAGALAATYLDLDVSHVEAGLRSGDPRMLEERNRIMVDSVAHRLFAYTEFERELLLRRADVRGEVYLEGNTTVDVLHDFADEYEEPPRPGRYVFVTMHRKEFTDSAKRMRGVFAVLNEIAEHTIPVLFPIHPRTRDVARRRGIDLKSYRHLEIVDPMPIFACLAHQKHAAAVLTDSGCIQEEAYMLGVPCITVRQNTERHLTLKHGANVLTGFSSAAIRGALGSILARKTAPGPSIYGAPGVGARIVARVASGREGAGRKSVQRRAAPYEDRAGP